MTTKVNSEVPPRLKSFIIQSLSKKIAALKSFDFPQRSSHAT